MDKLIPVFLLLNLSMLFGQSKPETYRFSKDLLFQIDKDTVAWKHQVGATELSFSGYFREVLQEWDKHGVRKSKHTLEDSLYFIKSSKVSAKDYITEQSKNAEMIIINEAHHISKHRTFTKTLLKELYANGYRYLGLEALFETTLNERKYAVIETGYYTKEPEFGNLIAEALKLGYILFSYEASEGKNGKEREIEQAEKIQKFIASNPKGKVLIHCGYAHAYENEYPAWGKAMAGRLKEHMNIDPLTIDQTMFLERSDAASNHLFIKLNKTKEPILLIEENGNVFNGLNEHKQTDIVVLHPQTEYINNRPDWLLDGRKAYNIPVSKIKNRHPLLVLVYRNGEFENNGIPADMMEITEGKSSSQLYLTNGMYTVVIKDKNYTIIDKYTIEIK